MGIGDWAQSPIPIENIFINSNILIKKLNKLKIFN